MSKRSRNGSQPEPRVQPPRNVEAERAMLAAALFDPRAASAVYRALPRMVIEDAIALADGTPIEHEPLMTDQPRQIVLGGLLALVEAGEEVNSTSLAIALESRGRLDAAGGATAIAAMYDDDALFSLGQARQYAEIVVDHWRRRQAARGLAQAAEQALTGRDTAALRQRLQTEVMGALEADSAKGLDLWDIDRIFGQADDPAACMVGDNLIEAGELCLVIGQQGIGKSRVVIQLAIDMIIGAERWLDTLAINRRQPKIMILQTENSARRWKRELALQMRGVTGEQRALIQRNLRIHVAQAPEDRILFLGDDRTVERLAATVREFRPDLVVFDPYSAFFAGDNENDARQHVETVAGLFRVAHAASNQTALVVVHHARSGRTAAASAVGWDSGAFSRGSKALPAAARSQINIAPGSADDSDVLVVACGKSNNGRPFEPFAIRLDDEQMIYRRDAEFDLEEWREEVAATGKRDGKGKRITPSMIQVLLRDSGGTMARKEFVALACQTFDCKSGIVYRRIKSMIDDLTLFERGGIITLPAADR